MTPLRTTVCVFDAYGTLFDVHSAVARHATALGPLSREISVLWRTKQLEYSWVRTLIRQHADFWELTEAALDYALAFHKIKDDQIRRLLLESYLTLDPYPEVPEVLRSLRAAGLRTAILSNGSPSMLESAVSSAGLDDLLDDCLSIEAIRIFKPDPAAYDVATAAFASSERREIAFFSSNAWDAIGAHTYGFHAFWLNRANQPEEYGLYSKVTRIESLSSALELLKPDTPI